MLPFDVSMSMCSVAAGSVRTSVWMLPFDVDVLSAYGGESGGSTSSTEPLLVSIVTEVGGSANVTSTRPLLVRPSKTSDARPVPVIDAPGRRV